MNLVYTRVSVEDLQRLRAFIAQHDPMAAARVAAELVRRIEMLRQFPELGHPVAQAPDPASIRDLVCGRHVVRYAKTETSVVILRIWHHAQERA